MADREWVQVLPTEYIYSGIFTNTTGSCPYCGGVHGGVCARVKAIEYHPNGEVKRVEFHDPYRFTAAGGGEAMGK